MKTTDWGANKLIHITMKTKAKEPAPRHQPQGVINTIKATLAAAGVALIILTAGSASGGEITLAGPALTIATTGAPSNTTEVVTAETNSALAKIQADLNGVQAKIASAVEEMRTAIASTPAQHAVAVSNLANQIRMLATNDLGDASAMMRGVEALQAKMQATAAKARAMSTDPAVSARETYGAVLLRTEAELGRLIDAKGQVAKIRFELLARAASLEADALAIGFAADADQAIIASTAFRKALSEAVAFSQRLERFINSLGTKGATIAPIS